MKIVVDRTKCAGIGICESFAPDVFEVDDGGDLVLHHDTVPEGLLADIDQAVESCPTTALSLQDLTADGIAP